MMKRRIKLMLAALVMTTLTAAAQSTVTIDLQKKWGPVMNAIEQVESEGRANIVSRDGRYVGCLQIAPILVRQCNIILGYNKFTLKDRYSKETRCSSSFRSISIPKATWNVPSVCGIRVT